MEAVAEVLQARPVPALVCVGGRGGQGVGPGFGVVPGVVAGRDVHVVHRVRRVVLSDPHLLVLVFHPYHDHSGLWYAV